jgi:DNA-binding MarR family transcriptional regulator
MSITASDLPFGAQLIGRTEKSLGALLNGILAGSGLSEPQYVGLRVCADRSGEPRTDVVAQLAVAFRKGESHAAELIDSLGSAGMIDTDQPDTIQLTPAGRELHARLVADTDALTQRLWGELPSDQLAVAARVLNAVLRRAASEHV